MEEITTTTTSVKHIPKNNVIMKTQDMSQNRTKLNNETVIFRLYFKGHQRTERNTITCYFSSYSV